MSYCVNCGTKNNENDSFCISCGVNLINPNQTQQQSNPPHNQNYTYSPDQHNHYPQNNFDKNSTGLNIISFIYPLIGLILYFIFKDEKPIRAKGILKFTLLSVGIFGGIILLALFVIFFIGLISSTL